MFFFNKVYYYRLFIEIGNRYSIKSFASSKKLNTNIDILNQAIEQEVLNPLDSDYVAFMEEITKESFNSSQHLM